MTVSFNDYAIIETIAKFSGSIYEEPTSNFTQLIAHDQSAASLATDIGFDFTFEGETYTNMIVTTCGVVQLVGDGGTQIGVDLAANDTNNFVDVPWNDPVLAAWWGDLQTTTEEDRGGVYKIVRPLGVGAHKQCIVRSIVEATYGGARPAYIMIIDVSLNTLGGIEFRYSLPAIKDDDGSVPSSSAAIIGVGMKARGGQGRYRYLRGDGFLAFEQDYPMRPNSERGFVMAPPMNLVRVQTDIVNARVIK